MEEITIDTLKKAFPSKKNTITQEVVDIINHSQAEAEFQGESLLQTAVTYQSVMAGNKVGIQEYINAVRFCAYIMTEEDNYTEAYKRVFIDRKFVQDRLDAKGGTNQYNELSSAASRYRRSKVVVDILTMSQLPLDLMFTGHRYKAIGVLADLMFTAKSDMAKVSAAKELLAATKGADNINMKLEMGLTKEARDIQEDLNSQLAKLAANQRELLMAGLDIKEVQKTGVNLNIEYIDAEVE